MRAYVKDWCISATVDDDGHLTLAVTHEDGTRPYVLDFDLEEDRAWVERFSTPAIETAYAKKEEL